MSELWELSAEETARRVRAREVSAVDVVESALARTARVEPLIHAWLELFEDEARERAAEIDRESRGVRAARRGAGRAQGQHERGRLAAHLRLEDPLRLCGSVHRHRRSSSSSTRAP